MIEDAEDDYAEYVDDERGYAWDAWDVVPQAVMSRHDGILHASAEALADIDPGGLDDLDRWAYARAAVRHGDPDGFLAAARLVIASTSDHRGIDYADVFVSTIERLADAADGDEAQLHLAAFRERWPDDTRASRLELYVAIRSGVDADETLDRVFETHRDDPELLFELVEDLVRAGRRDQATRALDDVRRSAKACGQTALMVDIALLESQLRADVPADSPTA